MAAPRFPAVASQALSVRDARSRRCGTRWRRARASTRASRKTCAKCSRLPAPPEATSGTLQTAPGPRRAARHRSRCGRRPRPCSSARSRRRRVPALRAPSRACRRAALRLRVRVAGVLVHAPARRRRAWLSMPTTTHCVPKRRASSSISAGSLQGRGVDGDLLRARREHGLGVGDAANAAGHAERDVEHAARPGRSSCGPPSGPAGLARDVVEDQFVGAFVAIALRRARGCRRRRDDRESARP